MKGITKSKLAIILSKLRDFDENILHLEQYSTPSEIAADVVWKAFMAGDVENKTILDPACGPGYFGIACLLLGAKKVYFVDIDEKAIDILKSNLNLVQLKNKRIEKRYLVKKIDIKDFDEKVEVIIQNPPFGTKQKHADKIFLEKAFEVSKTIYSIHKITSKDFIRAISKDYNFEIEGLWEYDFELKQTQKFHKKRIQRIKVGCWKLEKI